MCVHFLDLAFCRNDTRNRRKFGPCGAWERLGGSPTCHVQKPTLKYIVPLFTLLECPNTVTQGQN